MQILNTIIPIFVIIAIGLFARKKGFIPTAFLEPANRLVFYLAIPAMVFGNVAKASLKTQFDPIVLLIMLLSVLAVFALAWTIGSWIGLKKGSLATFIQNSIHGNLGYIGLAVAYYYLGKDGFVRASILMGFLMILQNFLAVFILQLYSPGNRSERHFRIFLGKIIANPIILSAVVGIVFSALELHMPIIIDRSLGILSSMALPTALLIIGASLSFDAIRSKLPVLLTTGFLKLIILPTVGFAAFVAIGIPAVGYLPCIILLASPTATVSYVMAREMAGDVNFAVAAISINTLLSAVTFSMWLKVAG